MSGVCSVAAFSVNQLQSQIYSSVNGLLSSSNHVLKNAKITSEWWTGKDVEGGDRGLISGRTKDTFWLMEHMYYVALKYEEKFPFLNTCMNQILYKRTK
jgi:hypothetical protein